MRLKQITRKQKIILLFALLLLTAISAGLVFLHCFPAKKRADYKRLSSESYDTVFLSMYPNDNIKEEFFSFYKDMTAVVTSYEIPDLATLKSYFEYISESDNTVSTIYLGIRPDRADASALLELLQAYPDVQFEIILAHPSLEYWQSLSEKKCNELLQAYRDFILPLMGQEHISLYHFGASEWLIANPANYEEMFLTNTDISRTLLLLADQKLEYYLTSDNAENVLDAMNTLIVNKRTTPANYPDLSNWNIVFFGDSIIGNFTSSTSIPNVTGGLTHAHVFNLGYGGGSAAETDSNNFSLPDAVNVFLQKELDTVPTDAVQLRAGMDAYLQAPEQEQLCFIINFGLNDYFSGLPIASEDPYDKYTYAGALRSSVKELQSAYPNAYIVLVTPNYTSYFGSGTERMSASGDILENYANAVIALSEELQVGLLDNYNELGINDDNWPSYLSDGCHPNETGRFIIGQRIAFKIQAYE